MKRIKLWIGAIAVAVATCVFASGCGPFEGQYTNLPATSGPPRPIKQCSEQDGSNAYLEVDIQDSNSLKTVGTAWIFTKSHQWVKNYDLHIMLEIVGTHLAEVSWWADLTNVDWMNAAYQGWFGVSGFNTLMPEHSRAHPFTQQALSPLSSGQRYATYAALPPDQAKGLGCYHPNGAHPFLSP